MCRHVKRTSRQAKPKARSPRHDEKYYGKRVLRNGVSARDKEEETHHSGRAGGIMHGTPKASQCTNPRRQTG